jgi:hypothetical protein
MSDWRTYRNGNPRQDLERLARHRAAKLGYRVHKRKDRKFMLIHKASSTVLLGAGYGMRGPGYTATIESILEFMERERLGENAAVRRKPCALSANRGQCKRVLSEPRLWREPSL